MTAAAIRHSPTILHLGAMFWPPNVSGVLWFGRKVLPQVWREQPEARFVIVGKNPPAEVRDLAADPCIQVSGYVDAVVRLLTDEELNRRLRVAGRCWVEKCYAWQSVYRQVIFRTRISS